MTCAAICQLISFFLNNGHPFRETAESVHTWRQTSILRLSMQVSTCRNYTLNIYKILEFITSAYIAGHFSVVAY